MSEWHSSWNRRRPELVDECQRGWRRRGREDGDDEFVKQDAGGSADVAHQLLCWWFRRPAYNS